MQTILLIFQVILASAIIGIVLIQRSDQDGFGLGSGSGTGLISGRAKSNFFTRATAILAALFMINSLVFSLVSTQTSTSLIERIPAATQEKRDLQQDTPSAESVPLPGDSAPQTEESMPDTQPIMPVEEKPIPEPEAVPLPGSSSATTPDAPDSVPRPE